MQITLTLEQAQALASLMHFECLKHGAEAGALYGPVLAAMKAQAQTAPEAQEQETENNG